MDCNEFRQMLDAYIDGELSAEQEALFLKHADECESCQCELRDACALRDLMGNMQIEVPLPARAAWQKAVKLEAQKNTRKRLGRYISVAAVLVAVFGCSLLIKTPEKQADMAFESSRMAEAAVETAIPLIASDGVTAENASGEDFDVREVFAVKEIEAAQKTVEDLCREYGAEYSVEKGSGSVIIRISIDSAFCDEFTASLKTVGRETDALHASSGDDTTVIIVQLVED